MKVYITERQILFLKENALYFIQRNGKLYPMGSARKLIDKDSITWDEFDYGISQKLIKMGYKIGITEAKTPWRVKMWNDAGFFSDSEKELFYTYPQYFIDFIIVKNIEELGERGDMGYVISMSSKIKNRYDRPELENEKNAFKKELADWLMNHEVYRIYLHRFVQDYILPMMDKQNYIDKLKRHEKPDYEDHIRLSNTNLSKPNINIFNNYEYKDVLKA